MSKKDIAVIGMSCKFSDSEDINEYWVNLREGKELLHFYTAGEIERLNISKTDKDSSGYIKVKSLIKDKNSFDFSFFGYTKDEASIMDPQTRIFHEYTWKALEDAGYDPYQYAGRIGIFAGTSDNINWSAHNIIIGERLQVDPFFRSLISNKNHLSSLISYKLNLRGPSYFINTACSTSLSAIHLASRSLLMMECNMAIAGAVRLDTSTRIGYRHTEGMIYSRDGHCRTFDAESSGTVNGDGTGVVILKRASDALKDGDHIYAIIKSSFVNNDGSRKVGFTAPSVAGQAECIMMAHKLAEVSPETISYIEAHGTATRLGDPIEIEALNRAFGNSDSKYCAIGSVKSNIGHLDTAAGVAGFIKTVLSLHHKELFPSLHFNKPNPEIDFEGGPFYVNTRLKKWEAENGLPLRAGVSSFGIGGTNVHMVLEEAPVSVAGIKNRPFSLLLCSAKTENALYRQLDKLKTTVGQGKDTIGDIAFTLQARRKHFNYRSCLVCNDDDDAIDNWSAFKTSNRKLTDRPNVIFMFSGQGGQYVNMTRGLYDTETIYRNKIDEGLALLKEMTGEDHSDILFNDEHLSGNTRIDDTRYTQPLLFICEYALAKLLMEWGIKPDRMIGHSIGELVAACVGGVFSFEDGLLLVLHRAALMSALPGGSMISIRLPHSAVIPLLEEGLSIAAINTAELCVVSGPHENIAKLALLLNEKGVATRKLLTSHAFHSAMMIPAVDRFGEKTTLINLQKPTIPFVSNVSGRMIGDEVLSPGYWASHIRETVQFADGIDTLINKGGRSVFIEIGPGNTLTTFCRQMDSFRKSKNITLNLVRHLLDDISDQRLLTERLGELWLNNIDIDWKAFYKYETGKAVSLPTYCFDKSVFTTEVDSVATINDWIVNADPLRKKKDVSDWFYLPRLMSSSLLKNVPREYKFNNYLFFSDESAVSSRLKAYLTDKGHSVIEVLRGDLFEVINPETFRIDHLNQLGYIELMEKLRSIGFEPDQMIFTWGLPDPGKMPSEAGAGSEYLKESLFWLLYLCKAFKFEEIRENKKLFVITHQYYDLFNAAGTTTIQASACLGLLKVLFQENGHFFCSHLDISLEEDPGNLVPDIYDELKYNDIHPTVVLRKGMRWRETYEQVSVAKDKKNIPVKKKGTYLITGGLGKLGVCIAGYLLERYEANVILIGRTELPPEEEWDGLIADKSAGGKMVDKIAGFLDLREKPGWVCYRHANIAEYHELAHLVEEMESTFGKIDGVIHAAGHLDAKSFKAVERITGQDVRMHFEPKVDGSFNLSRIFKDRSPDFVWVASSLSTVLGGLTYGAYTAANLFMDQLVTVRKTELAEWIVIDLDALALQKTDTVDSGINSQEMVEVFERSFQLIREKRIVISISDLDKRIDKYIKKKPDKNDGKPGKDLAPLAENKQGGGQVLEKSSSAEAKLIAIWKDFFGIESIDADADFFELGGDSLKAMTLSKRLHKDLGVDIPIKRFFSNSTIRLLAREINMALSLKALEPDSNKNKKEIIL